MRASLTLLGILVLLIGGFAGLLLWLQPQQVWAWAGEPATAFLSPFPSSPTPSPAPSSSPQAPTAVQKFYYGPANCHTTPTIPHPGGDRQQYADYIMNIIAPRYHLEAAILLWQVQQESGFNPKALSSAGAEGIAQFMPATAAAYHLDPWNPWQALDGMARYDLNSLRSFWDWSYTIAAKFGGNRNAYAWGLALAAYNAGGGNTGKALGWAQQRHWKDGPWMWLEWFGNANQTFYYVPDILGCLATR